MQTRAQITAQDAADMLRHWLGCPPGGYLGSEDYGSDIKALLQTPMATGLADDLISKARSDIPLLGLSSNGVVNVYAKNTTLDKKTIFFEVAGKLIPVGDATR